MKLEDEPDPVIPEADDRGIVERCQAGAVDRDVALIGAIEPAEHVQERAFAHA